MKKKKTIIISLITATIILTILWLKPLKKETETGNFQLAEITRGNLENIVSSSGTLSAVETVEVGSQVSGIVEKLLVDFNHQVKKGQVLAVLDKTLFQVSVKDAQAGLSRAKARLAQAEAEVKRNHPLFQKGHLSEMEFLTITTNRDTAKADLITAQAALNRAKTNLDYTVIRSPIDGTVIERTVDMGQTIAASFQAPKLFVIAEDLTRMQIETNVDESDIGQIKEGLNVRFTVQAYLNDTFRGTVRQIRLQPTTIQNVVNYTVVVDASNEKGRLLPGMTATVDFMIDERKDVLLISNAALNFTPSMGMMESMKKGQQPEKNRHTDMGDFTKMGHKLSDNMGRAFYLDNNSVPQMAIFMKGVSDGMNTVVKDNTILREGMKVITSFRQGNTSANSEKKSFLLPPPGGGRH